MVKAVEAAVKGQKDAKATLVLMAKDEKTAAEKLEKFAKDAGISIPLTVSKSGEKSPDGYKINDKVKNTIFVYKKKKVVTNFALNSISEANAKEVLEAVKKNIASL